MCIGGLVENKILHYICYFWFFDVLPSLIKEFIITILFYFNYLYYHNYYYNWAWANSFLFWYTKININNHAKCANKFLINERKSLLFRFSVKKEIPQRSNDDKCVTFLFPSPSPGVINNVFKLKLWYKVFDWLETKTECELVNENPDIWDRSKERIS
jgi:hypothetical protein